MKKHGQTILEFTFCMIIVLLLIYAAIMIFRWSGLDLAFRRSSHEHVLIDPIVEDWGDCLQFNSDTMTCELPSFYYNGPIRQFDPYYYKPIAMNAVWTGQ